jgi:hypothetical protein
MRISSINNRPVQVMDVDFPVDEHGRNLIKPSTIGYYQMVKGCAETGSFIPNIKTEYIAITATCFLISHLLLHYQIKVYVTGNTWVPV